jgi:hypothetical protein
MTENFTVTEVDHHIVLIEIPGGFAYGKFSFHVCLVHLTLSMLYLLPSFHSMSDHFVFSPQSTRADWYQTYHQNHHSVLISLVLNLAVGIQSLYFLIVESAILLVMQLNPKANFANDIGVLVTKILSATSHFFSRIFDSGCNLRNF